MKEAWTREGVKVWTPIVLDLASDPYIMLSEAEKHRYFSEQGYLVVRGIVPRDICGKVIETYQKTCKLAELAKRSAEGESDFVGNDHLVREIFLRHGANHPYQTLEEACKTSVNHPALREEVSNLLGPDFASDAFIYFDSSRGSRTHRDIDPYQPGDFVGAWIALRDISHESARFFVCPKSHMLEIPRFVVDLFHRDTAKIPRPQLRKNGYQRYSSGEYERAISKFAVDQGLEFRAPIINAGDVVFFNNKLIHGSLFVADPHFPRDSIITFYSR